MEKIYIFKSSLSANGRRGVDYFSYFVLFPGNRHSHAYCIDMSKEGFFQFKQALKYEVIYHELKDNENLWTVFETLKTTI